MLTYNIIRMCLVVFTMVAAGLPAEKPDLKDECSDNQKSAYTGEKCCLEEKDIRYSPLDLVYW